MKDSAIFGTIIHERLDSHMPKPINILSGWTNWIKKQAFWAIGLPLDDIQLTEYIC